MKLLIKASTNSEWDNANLIVVDLDKDTFTLISEYFNIHNDASKKSKDLSFTSFWFGFETYDDDNDEYDGPEYPFKDEEYFQVVKDFPEDGLGQVPENALDAHQIKFGSYGFSFKCYGEHTGEEFWSETISFEDFQEIGKLLI